MNNNQLVSVIMNCYNGKTYLKESIESLINQTYKNWELIFWDNQSIDSSKEIFFKFKNLKFKYFYAPKHEILYKARNAALEKAKGDYIAFLDTDDLWEPRKIETQLKLFDNEEVALVYGKYWINYQNLLIPKRLNSYKDLPKGFIFEDLVSNYVVGLPTIMLRRKYLENFPNIFNFEYNMLSDYDFVLRFSKRYKFDCVQKPVGTYRIHRGNLSNKYLEQHIDQFKKWLKYNSKTNFFTSTKQRTDLANQLMYLEAKYIVKKSNFFFSFRKVLNFPGLLKKIKLLIFLLFRKYFF